MPLEHDDNRGVNLRGVIRTGSGFGVHSSSHHSSAAESIEINTNPETPFDLPMHHPPQSLRRNPMYLPPGPAGAPGDDGDANGNHRQHHPGGLNIALRGGVGVGSGSSITTRKSPGDTETASSSTRSLHRHQHRRHHLSNQPSSNNNPNSQSNNILSANMIKSGLYPVSDRSKPSRTMTFLGIFLRVLFAFSMVAIPILVLFYFIYYEPLHHLMASSDSSTVASRSMLFASNPSSQIYKVDSLSSVFVKTKSGTVQGERIDVLNKEIDVFLGVPYAEPPLGDLRFRKGKEVKPWNGIYRAIRHSRPCLQYRQDHRFSREATWISTVLSSEDCLYLNIWSSVNKKPSASNLKPVLIFIHGGFFISGSSDVDALDGGILSAYGDIVVVTFNYRLGVLGFLNANHESSPGNVGLHDQALAIKWVRNNIESFGGDPDKITLASHGNSVGYHLVSPVTRELFRRGIVMSGSPLTPQILEDANLSLDRSQQLAVRVSCANERVNIYKHPEDVVNCLRKLEANFLAKAADDMMTGIHPPFSVSVGNEFLPFNPYGAIRVESELGSKKELLIGSVKDEGSLLLQATFPKIFTVQNPKKVSAQQVIPLIEEAFRFLPNPGPKMITHFFMTDLNMSDHNHIRDKFYETIGDFVTLCPAVFFAENMALQNFSTYHYFFTHRPTNSHWGRWMGVVHFDEVPFVFGLPFTKPTDFSEDEREFSARMMETWVSFIKNGKPTAQLGRSWPKYYPEDRKYMKLDPYANEINVGPHEHQCNLWRFMFQTASKP